MTCHPDTEFKVAEPQAHRVMAQGCVRPSTGSPALSRNRMSTLL